MKAVREIRENILNDSRISTLSHRIVQCSNKLHEVLKDCLAFYNDDTDYSLLQIENDDDNYNENDPHPEHHSTPSSSHKKPSRPSSSTSQ